MRTGEERWIALARAGDKQAFRHLVDAHARPLYAICVRITRDPAIAEDAVQEALFNAYRHLSDFDGTAQFGSWLHRIAVNEALQQLRKRGRHETTPLEDDTNDHAARQYPDDAPGPDRHTHSAQIRREVETQLGAMSALERTAFLLRHYEGQSLEYIATTLSMNVGACKQAVFRAVRKLRIALEPMP